MIDIETLKGEIETDPLGLGYAQHIDKGDDTSVADLLNSGAYEVDAVDEIVTPLSLLKVHESEFKSLAGDALLRLQCLMLAAQGGVRASQFPFSVVRKKQGTRAEVLFGSGTTVTHIEVAKALRNGYGYKPTVKAVEEVLNGR